MFHQNGTMITAIDKRSVPSRVTKTIFRSVISLTARHGLNTLARINANLFRQGEVIEVPCNASLYIPPDPHYFGFALGLHEKHISSLMMAVVRSGDTCVDVGANIGYFTTQMAALVGKTGRVVAIEPLAETYIILQRNARLANREAQIVTVLNAAASSDPGVVRILRRGFSTHHGVERIEEGKVESNEKSRSIRLDEELPQLGVSSPIRFLKIDVEGHEALVLKGCEKLLHKGAIAHMVLEVTPGADLPVIETIIQRHKGEYECWIGNAWKKLPLSQLPYRTDVRVQFPIYEHRG